MYARNWDTYTTVDGNQFAVRTLNDVTAVATFGARRITVELDLFDYATGACIATVSNVIRDRPSVFDSFADAHLEIAVDTR